MFLKKNVRNLIRLPYYGRKNLIRTKFDFTQGKNINYKEDDSKYNIDNLNLSKSDLNTNSKNENINNSHKIKNSNSITNVTYNIPKIERSKYITHEIIKIDDGEYIPKSAIDFIKLKKGKSLFSSEVSYFVKIYSGDYTYKRYFNNAELRNQWVIDNFGPYEV